MNARICASPGCRTIQTGSKCGNCGNSTIMLPKLSLSLIGVEGKAHLEYSSSKGYSLLVDTPSGFNSCPIPTSDLLQSAQPHLPNINEAGGLRIMDTLREAARLINTKNTGHWSGWVIYLIEALHTYTDKASYLEMLKDLKAAVALAVDHFETTVPDEDAARRLPFFPTTHTGNVPPRVQ